MLSVTALSRCLHFTREVPSQRRPHEYLGQLSDQGGYGEQPLLGDVGCDVRVDGDRDRRALLGGHDDDRHPVFDGQLHHVAGEEVHDDEVEEVEEGGGDQDDDDVLHLLGEEDGCGAREGLPDDADEVGGREQGEEDTMVADPFQHPRAGPTHQPAQYAGDEHGA